MSVQENWKALIALVIAGVILAGCAAPTPTPQAAAQPTSQAAAQPASRKLKVALGTFGPVTDAGWSATHYEGLKRVEKEYGAEISLTDGVEVPKFESVLRDYCSQGYDLVFGQSFGWGEPAMKVAKDYANCKMVITTGIVSATNVASFWPMEVENYFLSGVLAAHMTKTGKIGVIGGVDLPNMRAKMNAVIAGAKYVNPDVKVVASFVGSFTDPALGKEIAMAQIAEGADVIDQMASTSGLGAIEAAREKNVWLISDVVFNRDLAPDNMIGAHVARFGDMVAHYAKQTIDGTFEGKVWRPGLATGMIDLEMGDLVPADVINQVQDVKQKIIKGEIKIEETFDLPGG